MDVSQPFVGEFEVENLEGRMENKIK